jgi:hypothetical protein
MIGNLAAPMPILMPLALVSTLPVLILLYRQKLLKAFYLTLVGLTLFVVALLATLLGQRASSSFLNMGSRPIPM